MRRLLQLERKFAKQPDLKEEYVKVIEDYAMLNHLEEVPAKEITQRKLYTYLTTQLSDMIKRPPKQEWSTMLPVRVPTASHLMTKC